MRVAGVLHIFQFETRQGEDICMALQTHINDIMMKRYSKAKVRICLHDGEECTAAVTCSSLAGIGSCIRTWPQLRILITLLLQAMAGADGKASGAGAPQGASGLGLSQVRGDAPVIGLNIFERCPLVRQEQA